MAIKSEKLKCDKEGEKKYFENQIPKCVQLNNSTCCIRIASAEDYYLRVIDAREDCTCSTKCEDLGQDYKCVESYQCDNGASGGSQESKCYRNDNIDLADKSCEDHKICCKKVNFERKKCQEEDNTKLSEYNSCGRGRTIPGTAQRFVNGGNIGLKLEAYVAQIGEFPHMCFFYSKEANKNAVFRGGASLIGKNMLLTTAHKIKGDGYNYETDDLEVRCGVLSVDRVGKKMELLNLDKEQNLPATQDRSVKEVVMHPNYDFNFTRHNMAILIVENNFKYNDHIGPVCLPEPNENFEGVDECYSTGWGTNEHDSSVYSKLLKKLKLTVMESKTCEKKVNEDSRTNTDKNNERVQHTIYGEWMCLLAQGPDTCRGDGGSPHVCDIKGKWVQVGAVSHGWKCNQENVPAIYSNVAVEMCWIDWVMSCKQGRRQASSKDYTPRSSSAVTTQSVNNLKERDCQKWLDDQPELKKQCDVKYRG